MADDLKKITQPLVAAIHDDRAEATAPQTADIAWMVGFLKRWKYAIPIVLSGIGFAANYWIVEPIKAQQKELRATNLKVDANQVAIVASQAMLATMVAVTQNQNLILFQKIDKFENWMHDGAPAKKLTKIDPL